MICASHPGVETYLRCGRCNKTICPRCLVMTPGGQKCRGCAQLRRPPMYDAGPLVLARAGLAAAGAGLAGGIIWGLLPLFLGFFILLLAAGFGYAMAEAVGRATNRKRGRNLQVIAAGGVMLAFLLRNLVFKGALLTGDIFGYIAVAIAIFVANNALK